MGPCFDRAPGLGLTRTGCHPLHMGAVIRSQRTLSKVMSIDSYSRQGCYSKHGCDTGLTKHLIALKLKLEPELQPGDHPNQALNDAPHAP